MRKLIAVVAGALALALLVPFVAVAAARPASIQRLEVQYAPGRSGRQAIIVTAILPETATLPALVRMPLVPDGTVSWAGEIVGNVNQDIQRTPKTSAGRSGAVLEITASKSRVVQYEADLGASTTTGTVDGTLHWVQTVETGPVQFTAEVPQTAKDVKMKPSADTSAVAGEESTSLYSLPPRTLALGQKFDFEVSYSMPGASGSGSGSGIPVWAIGLAAIAAAALAVVLAFRSARQPAE